ncbi:RHS repeat-associated core domain-containing protein [Simulacricoccus sp. 17bor-14]|nr:RHS repeat-associated core domain-containing protein [Simulacricoccus sp. 17bor-14]
MWHLYQTGSPQNYCKPKDDCKRERPANKCLVNGSPRGIYGDPVDLASGKSVVWRDDYTASMAQGSVVFSRTYHSQLPADKSTNAALMPKPFGSDPRNSTVAAWTHSLYERVEVATGSWRLRLGSGSEWTFGPCSTVNCWAVASGPALSERVRLQYLGNQGFRAILSNGEQREYAAQWKTGAAYFLTRIKSSKGAQLATLSYATPPPATPPSVSCGAGSTGGAVAPFLSRVDLPLGESLGFDYVQLDRLDGSGPECVLRALKRMPNAGGVESTPLATYSYTVEQGSERPGRLLTVAYSDGRSEEYSYPTNGGASNAGIDVKLGGLPVVSHGTDSSSGDVTSVTGPGENVTISAPSYVPCAVPGTCAGSGVVRHTVTDLIAGVGNGNPQQAQLTHEYDVLASSGESGQLYQVTDSCLSSGACSPGTQRYEYARLADAGSVAVVAEKDKRNSWTTYDYVAVTLDGGVQTLERRSEKRGALDADGGSALEETRYQYVYAPETTQQVSSAARNSVLVPGGDAATTYRYDADGRLAARYDSGFSQTFDPTSGVWSVVPKVRATFYFKRQLPGGTDDPHGRTLEMHGPCWVGSTADTDCTAAPFAKTLYTYFPDSAGWPSAGKLQSVAVGGTDLPSPLITAYAYSSANGEEVTTTTDPNGQSVSSYVANGRLLRRSEPFPQVGAPSLFTVYSYDSAGHIEAEKHPKGDFEVTCYRAGTDNWGCVGGTLTDKVQWRARAADAAGAQFSEKVLYAYWPDGTLQKESFIASNGEVRRVRTYAADAHRRRTLEGWGEGSGAYSAKKGYDAADNLSAIGASFNSPPSWCAVTGPNGQPAVGGNCTAMLYDRADRLVQVEEYPSDKVPTQRTLFAYDAQGNVSGVKVGCSGSDTYASCTQPSTAYQFDDFGGLVKVTSPAMGIPGGSGGAVNYAHDAAGNTTIKQTPTMAATSARDYLEYGYDSLGRLTALTHRNPNLTTGGEVLYAQAYDASATMPAGCGVLENTKGRLLWRDDSFGRTWYSYDASGRTTREVRIRTGAMSGCSVVGSSASAYNNPNTSYAYDVNGNLLSIEYPYGRVVNYDYGANPELFNRVQAVRMTTFGAAGATSTVTVISHLAWEPYGDLRGYQLHLGTNVLGVEYALGQAGNTPPAYTALSDASQLVPDTTGRTRALWVTNLGVGGTFVPGSGSGNILRQFYTWTADQVVRSDTHLLGATTPRTETYSYDKLLRLTAATGTLSAAGGSFGSRAYSYDARGNRTSESGESRSWTLSRSDVSHPDWLTARAPQSSGWLNYQYSYDADGRLSGIGGPRDSQGIPFNDLSFNNSGNLANGGSDTVFRTASIGGAAYSYYYDAQNRRRAKVYPSGAVDEFFYDTVHDLLVDVGNTSAVGATNHPTDEYVWLSGRPIALVRGLLDSSYARQSDATTDCVRLGEGAACGIYALATDWMGKPVLALDSNARVTGVGEHDAFGHVNRVAISAETPHPYGTFRGAFGGTLKQPTVASTPATQLQMRLLYEAVELATDCEAGCAKEACSGAPSDAIEVRDAATNGVLTSLGARQRHGWTSWVTPGTSGVSLYLKSLGGCGVQPGACSCSCDANARGPDRKGMGAAFSAYEYRRYQTGAQPLFTPIRFPGQYHDAETDLFENWNRYYDPSIGRYLQPEPLAMTAARAAALPVYGYGKNNPLRNTDPNGRHTLQGPPEEVCPNWPKALQRAKEAAGCAVGGFRKCGCPGKVPEKVCEIMRDRDGLPILIVKDPGLSTNQSNGNPFPTARPTENGVHWGYTFAQTPLGPPGQYAAGPIIAWIEVRDDACWGGSDLAVQTLAKSILHESFHAYKLYAADPFSDSFPQWMTDNWWPVWSNNAERLTSECFGG